MDWRSAILVALGGGAGSVCRFFLQTQLNLWAGASYPAGTLGVNLLGCLLLGVILRRFQDQTTTNQLIVLLLGAGFCGGFTTFSTFAMDGIKLLQQNEVATALWYLILSVAGGLLAAGLGYWAGGKI